jgi:hypothetical protein
MGSGFGRKRENHLKRQIKRFGLKAGLDKCFSPVKKGCPLQNGNSKVHLEGAPHGIH